MQETGTNIYTKLSKKYNLPLPIIKVICNHPFLFANRRITEGDVRPLMFTYLGKIKIKAKHEKKYIENQDSKSSEQ